jgi:ribosomal protein S27AE
MGKNDDRDVMKEFEVRKNRQLVAIVLTVFIVLLCGVLYKRPVLYANFFKEGLFGAQIVAIVAFVSFSALNWKCPSCGKYLGGDIHRQTCKKCGVRLQK